VDSELKTSGKKLLKTISAWSRKADEKISGFVNTRIDGTPGDDDLRVFVSYRRDAGPGDAHHLASDLEKHLGPDRVFLDQRTIAAGEEWSRVIQERVGACDVLLAVIGPGWLECKDDEGQLRLTSEDDYVRHEIEEALKRHVPVILVSTPGAKLPKRDELPDTLKPMTDHPELAIEILREEFWAVAVDSLGRWLDAIKDDKLKARKRVKRAADTRTGLEKELARVTDRQKELTTSLQEAKSRLATLEHELPAAAEELEQRRREAEPSRSGPGIRACVSFRSDTAGQAARLVADLKQRLGSDHVVATESDQQPADRVAGTDVLLTLIGPGWLTTRDAAGTTLEDPGDTVRLEMEAALTRGIPLIPLLIHVHDVPQANVLPDSVRRLLSHQALPLPDQFWDSAVDKLVAEFDKIERGIERREAASSQAAERHGSLQRDTERARKLQSESETALKITDTKLAALRHKLGEAAAEDQRLATAHADEYPAFLAGPPRPRAGAVH
jgi:hypothetical protein